MKASEILREAKHLIGTPEKWWDGGPYDGPRRECIITAITCVQGSDAVTKADKAMMMAVGASHFLEIGEFNDSHSHADVMQAFDRAIALALADERLATVQDAGTGQMSENEHLSRTKQILEQIAGKSLVTHG